MPDGQLRQEVAFKIQKQESTVCGASRVTDASQTKAKEGQTSEGHYKDDTATQKEASKLYKATFFFSGVKEKQKNVEYT